MGSAGPGMRDLAGTRAVPDTALHTEVVIVGNGPSGLCLSQLLAGHVPYLQGCQHPDELLAARLAAAGPAASLLEQDLRSLAQGLEGRSRNPLALLLDALARPGADLGLELPSLLHWRHEPGRRVEHVVLGRGRPGGAWQAMDGGILTLSLASWMELPGLDFRTWEGGGGGGRGGAGRVTAATVARYYSDYVPARGLGRFVRSGCVVTSVRPLGGEEPMWLVEGYEQPEERPADSGSGSGSGSGMGAAQRFCYCARHVVLASGAYDLPNELGVPGEGLAHHDLRALEITLDKLAEEQLQLGRDPDPVLVVGAGLSAADAVIAARHRGLPVLHAFRRRAAQVDSQLPSSMYPEYHKVHQMMRDGGASYPRYTALPETNLLALRPGRAWLLGPPSPAAPAAEPQPEAQQPQQPAAAEASLKRGLWHAVSAAAVLVGARPDLRYVRLPGGAVPRSLALDPAQPLEPRSNPLAVDAGSYRVLRAPPGLYALGPLAGDTFVRFVMGGAVAVAADIHKHR